MGMRHILSKISLFSKTHGYLASIVFYCSTFGFPLASHCRKPTRSQGSKIDENYFKVEYSYYKWACATFCPGLVFSLKPLATWLPLFSIVQPLASHCRKPTRSQGSKTDENYFKVEYLFPLQLALRHILSKISFFSRALGYLASIVFCCSTFGFPLASYCRKPTISQGP